MTSLPPELSFRNAMEPGKGAMVQVTWPREMFVDPGTVPDLMFDRV